MALRCSGWSWEATGATRTAERPAGFFPPALSPAVGTGKKLPFAGNFEVVADFLGGVGSGREGEEEEE